LRKQGLAGSVEDGNHPPVARNPSAFNASIQGLRGLAALLVFVFHIYDMSRKQSAIVLPYGIVASLNALPSGVDIFFMISGYLITGSLIRHANLRAFFADRVARIYPVFLFLHVFLFALAPVLKYKWMIGITPLSWIFHFLSNLLFLPGLLPLPLMQLNAWSLSYEAGFYLLSAAVYLFWSKARYLAYVIVGGVIPALLAVYPRAAFFVVGASVFFLMKRRRANPASWSPRLGTPGFLGFLLVMSFALTSPHIYLVWLALPFGFFFFFDVVRQMPPISSFLQTGLMQFFGKISYSFYLWHPVVTFPLKFAMARILIGRLGQPPVTAMLVFGLVAFALTIPISWLSWRMIEKPGGRWVRSRLIGGTMSRRSAVA
jgi:peptidoglycan/LPS O-acetylase OafA/YrhL